MEYRIFGPGGWPYDGFKDDLAACGGLDDKQRAAISEWFCASDSYDSWEPPLPESIAASTLLPEQFHRCADCVRFLLICWQRYGLDLSDIERDLLLLGVADEQRSILVKWLQDLSPLRERVWSRGRIGLQKITGLPTIDDVDFVLESRPVFAGDTYEYVAGSADERAYLKLVGFTNLIVMEIISSDNHGQKQRTAIQMTEETLQRLRKAMSRVGEQLAILNKRTSKLVQDF